MSVTDPHRSCAVCRFMRSFAFSAIGAAAAGYGALALGLGQNTAMIAAFFGALAAVLWSSRKHRGPG